MVVICSSNIPFYWDNITLSENACFHYDNSIYKIIPPTKSDFGNLTLYAYYLSVFWTIFGKSIFISHIAIIPIVIGVFQEIKKITLHFIKPEYLFLIYLLLLLDPAISAQLILIGYDVFLLYFVLLAIRTLLEKKYLFYSICLLILSTISIRAIIYIFCLLLIHWMILIFIKKNNIKILDALVYLPALIFLVLFSTFHYEKTGWIFVNPDNIKHTSLNNISMALRQYGFIIWKIIDSGRIALWIFVIVCGFVFFKRRKISNECKKLLLLLIIPIVINGIVMVIISNPIGHKYFLQTYVFLSIIVVYFLQNIVSFKKRFLYFSIFIVFLVGGNFIVYPQKYGNAWDTSLKVLPYFKLEQKMRAFVVIKKINPKEIYTEFPLNSDFKYSYLQDDFSYNELVADDITSYKFVLWSNVLNVANLKPYELVQQNWKLIYSISSGQISFKLYKNPLF